MKAIFWIVICLGWVYAIGIWAAWWDWLP